jgi:hypothetical protein
MLLRGVIRWLVDRQKTSGTRVQADADTGAGVLFSSGLIAGGAIICSIGAGLSARHLGEMSDSPKTLDAMTTSTNAPVIAYVVLLAVSLYSLARGVRSATR